MLKFIGSALGWIMKLCFDLTGNYGVSIILFTLITKVVLFPTAILTQFNSVKMIRLMPEENALRIKYVDDKDRLADERLALYKRYKYSPFVSLIPLFIQIPLVLGLVFIVYHPLSFTLGFPSDVIDSFRAWLASFSPEIAAEENAYQLEIINQIKHGSQLVPTALSDAAKDISALNMNFAGIDLSLTPSLKSFNNLLLIPAFSGLSALLMCFVQNKINVLQVAQNKLNKVLTTAFLISFSVYFSFLVPAGVGLYWIFGNLFSIPTMFILNAVIRPRKYIDYDHLMRMNQARIEKEKEHKTFLSREKADYKRFFEVKDMKLMIYSESKGFYKYFEKIIDYICENSDIDIHYVTSDPNDSIFADARKNIHAYYISSDKYLIPLFMKLESDMCLMTMPDLEKYHIKRSRVRKDVEYIYMPHGVGSATFLLRKGAIDWYDTIFAYGKRHVEDIRAMEEFYKTPRKRVVETGYPLIDEMNRCYSLQKHEENEIPQIIIAPSWQSDNIFDVCIDPLIAELQKLRYKIIVRPHPQQVRHEPERFEEMRERYRDDPNIEIQTDFSKTSPVMESDVLVTDWSDISWEFAYVTKRPVLFIDTPMKVMNPDYEEIDRSPISIELRSVIGRAVKPENISEVCSVVKGFLENKDQYRAAIEKTYHDHVFNVGRSAELCGRYIIRSIEGKL